MSKSQSEMGSEPSVPHKNCYREASSSNTSSEDEDISEIEVQIASKLNEIKRQTSTLKNYDQQIFELKKQNLELRQEVSRLIELVKHNKQDNFLKKQLKEKQREIQDLKRQVTESQYYQSSKNSKPQSAIRVDIEDRRYKLRSKSIRNNSKHRQSVQSDETQSVKLRVFDHTSELNKIKAEKLTLEKQFYELQEKILILQHQQKWMKNLAVKLVNFAQKLSYVFKEEIFHKNWNLLKKSKSSWRYLKHIMKFVLQIK